MKTKTSKTEAVYLPSQLVKEARRRLEEGREIELETYLSLYLRVMLRTKGVLKLQDIMPFGKYGGEIVENVVRADPLYMSWLVAQNGKTSFGPEVVILTNEMMER